MKKSKYNVTISISNKKLTDDKKKERIADFQDAFSSAAARYFSEDFRNKKEPPAL